MSDNEDKLKVLNEKLSKILNQTDFDVLHFNSDSIEYRLYPEYEFIFDYDVLNKISELFGTKNIKLKLCIFNDDNSDDQVILIIENIKKL